MDYFSLETILNSHHFGLSTTSKIGRKWAAVQNNQNLYVNTSFSLRGAAQLLSE
jgi:hypothetical protein